MRVLSALPGPPRVPRRRAAPRGAALRALLAVPLPAVPLPAVLLLAALLAVLTGCQGGPLPTGELREIQDDRHRIANPGILGASATGQGCGTTRLEALTSAERVG